MLDRLYTYRRLALIAVFSLVTIGAFAQDDWDNDGEIEDVEIEIVKDREIKLPRSSRNFDKIPPVSLESKKPEVTYFFSNLNLPIPDLALRVRPLRMKDEPLRKLYGNYVKAGFGNYTTPYFEGYVTSKRNRDHMYGSHVRFLQSQKGPVDGKNSGSGMFDASAFGKLFGTVVTVSGDVGYKRRAYHHYGYPDDAVVSEDTLDHQYNDVYLQASLENTDKSSKLDYLIGLQFNNLTDNYSAHESEVQLDFRGAYQLGEVASFNLLSDLDIMSLKDETLDVKTRNLFRIKPSFEFEYEGFMIDAGFNVVYENDTLGDSDELHFYPDVKARYVLESGFEIHAGIRGDVEKLTYRKLAYENPFIGPDVRPYNAYKTIEVYGGIGGALTSKLGFGAGISVASFKNMHYFVNRFDDVSKFMVIYDTGNTQVFNLNGHLGYNRSETFRLGLRADVWGYDTDELDNAYHKPKYRVSSNATYNLFDKVRLTGEAYIMGVNDPLIFSDPNVDQTPVSLDSFIDINVEAQYLVSDQFSAFVRVNNILSQEYERYYRYPSRGLQVMVGASYAF